MIKLGFYGGGVNSIAGKVHLISSEMTRKFKVVGGIFSRDREKSILSAKEYGVRHFEGIKEMEENVDAITILTPTPSHFEDIKKFSLPLIVDKPLCVSVEEAKEILRLNKKIVVTYNYSGYPLIREAKKIIENGLLGEIVKAKFFMIQSSFLKPFKPGYPQEWRKKDLEIPNLLLDLGVHIFHLARFLIGEFEIEYKKLNKISSLNVVDDCEMIGRANKATINFSCSKVALGNLNTFGFEIYGTKASLKWEQNSPEKLIFSDIKEVKITDRSNAVFEANKKRYNIMPAGHPDGFIEAFKNYYEDIYDWLNGKENEFIDDLEVSEWILRRLV